MLRAAMLGLVMTTVALGDHGPAPVRTEQVTHWANGRVQSRTPMADGRADGVARAWYADGQPMWVRGYRAGREEGLHLGWWPNGTPQFALPYRDGVLEGESREWYQSGVTFREASYRHGQEAGPQRMYDTEGTVRASYEVRGGRRYGSIGAMGCTPKEVAGDA